MSTVATRKPDTKMSAHSHVGRHPTGDSVGSSSPPTSSLQEHSKEQEPSPPSQSVAAQEGGRPGAPAGSAAVSRPGAGAQRRWRQCTALHSRWGIPPRHRLNDAAPELGCRSNPRAVASTTRQAESTRYRPASGESVASYPRTGVVMTPSRSKKPSTPSMRPWRRKGAQAEDVHPPPRISAGVCVLCVGLPGRGHDAGGLQDADGTRRCLRGRVRVTSAFPWLCDRWLRRGDPGSGRHRRQGTTPSPALPPHCTPTLCAPHAALRAGLAAPRAETPPTPPKRMPPCPHVSRPPACCSRSPSWRPSPR